MPRRAGFGFATILPSGPAQVGYKSLSLNFGSLLLIWAIVSAASVLIPAITLSNMARASTALPYCCLPIAACMDARATAPAIKNLLIIFLLPMVRLAGNQSRRLFREVLQKNVNVIGLCPEEGSRPR